MTTSVMEANAEALCANRSLEEIREVELRTRREANEKAEALRCEANRERESRDERDERVPSSSSSSSSSSSRASWVDSRWTDETHE